MNNQLAKFVWQKGDIQVLRGLGGPGSGNFGHVGRPGEIGGSSSVAGGTVSGGVWTRDPIVVDVPLYPGEEGYVPPPADLKKKGKVRELYTHGFNPAHSTELLGDPKAAEAYAEALVDKLPGEYDVTIRSSSYAGNTSVVVDLQRTKVDSDPDAEDERPDDFDFAGDSIHMQRIFEQDAEGKTQVHHDHFTIGEAITDQDIGKDVMRAQMDFYDKHGITKVDTEANIDVGGYAWARYGFQLAPSEVKVTKDRNGEWSTRFERMIDRQLGPGTTFSGEARRAITDTIEKHKNPNSGALDPKVVWALADLRTQRWPIINGKVVPTEHKLGAELLLDTHWDAEMDLKDPATRARAERYIGR
jgi:hypothetical protein